ncbi:MAG: ImmA/IrrE family metallo-endopeptidase [Candidatus Thiodiazotropha endolucinida]
MNARKNMKSDWAVPPGRTISDILNERCISIDNFSKSTGLSVFQARQLLLGNLAISNELASVLEETLGSTKSFWLKREKQYKEDIVRRDEIIKETEKWYQELPVNDMVKFGWITPSRNHKEKKKKCLDYFEVTNAIDWYRKYERLHFSTAFKISNSFESKAESIITWLRQGSIISNRIKCAPFNSVLFQEKLKSIRALTREKEPTIFLPALTKICAACGVAVVVVPTPSRCSASAATFFTSRAKATLLLSFRYLSEDHFWFSFFHESGHIVLHDRELVFLEGVDKENSVQEEEADDFAVNMLIPEEYKAEMLSFRSKDWRRIIRFAKKLGISPGIVVGQLQHHGLVPHNRLNKLKVRYKWSDIVQLK